MKDQIGDFLVFGVAVPRFLDDELDALGLGPDDAEAASGGLVLLDQNPNRRHEEGRQSLTFASSEIPPCWTSRIEPSSTR